MAWRRCGQTIGVFCLDDLDEPDAGALFLTDEEMQELRDSDGEEVICGCPLMLPREIESGECIYCRWDRENGPAWDD